LKSWYSLKVRLPGVSYILTKPFKLKGITMENEKQDQDLINHKPEETDNIQKSERPDDAYMKSRGLDPETQGKKQND